MQLLIRSLSSTFSVSVPAVSGVQELRQAVSDSAFYPPQSFVLRHGTNNLQASCSLAEQGVIEGETVAVHFDLDGGMRAKWRKKRMRRLRRKRRKMRQRAR